MTRRDRLLTAFLGYLDKRLLAVFLVGISSGFPLTLLLSNLGIWMREEQVDLAQIGLFSALTAPYSLKFLWAPIIDRVRLPLLADWAGQRRSWLFVTQAALVLATLAMASSDPQSDLKAMAVFAFCLALAAASQDIVIDAWRIEILTEEQQGQGAAMINFGYRTGTLIAGVGGLLVADAVGWNLAYAIMAGLVVFGIAAVLWVGEPDRPVSEGALRQRETAERLFVGATGWRRSVGVQLHLSVIAPFAEFMTRRGWWLVLAFILIFKVGDAMLQTMMNPMLVDLGFTKPEIAYASKTVGLVALLIGTALGGSLVAWIGMFRALLITTIFMMVTNLGFSLLALAGHDIPMLVTVVGLENFSSGVGLTVFVGYLADLCDRSFTATHYALMSSLAAVGRTFLVSPAGFLAEATGWPLFFVLTTLAAIPGILLLIWLRSYQFEPQKPPVTANS